MSENAKQWTIIAVADSGDTARVAAHPGETVKALRAKAVHELYGAHAEPEKYEVLIGETVIEDLEVSLERAGLHDGSEVLVQAIDVHRG